jgi:hypothetical protein
VDNGHGLVTNMAERTRAELERLLRPPVGEEDAVAKWRREVYQQELEHLDAREKREKEHEREREQEREEARARTTGAYMQQWYAYFDNVIANERAAMAEQLRNLREVMIEAAGEALAEVRREIETQNKCALDLALAEVRKGVVSLQKECAKQKGVVEKLLPEIALLKRQVAMLSDAQNKSLQNAVTHLGHRMTAMEGARHVVDQSAMAELEKRLNAAAQLAASLPSWMIRGSQF